MYRRQIVVMAILSFIAFSSGPLLAADEHEEQQALLKAIGSAKVTLQQGLAAAEANGQPISAKFEVEDGKPQLSVYGSKDGKFFEVVVDYATGKVAKSEPITEGDDLAAAKAQSAAMAKAKTTLKAAVDKVLGQSPGFRAIGVTPSLKDGPPIASSCSQGQGIQDRSSVPRMRRRMSRMFRVVAAICAGMVAPSIVAGLASAQPVKSLPVRLEAKVPLGDVRGRIDHMAIDLARQRLFVAELGNDSVGVVDLKDRKVLRTITGLKEPQGVGYVPSTDTLYVANAGDGSLRLFRGDDYSDAGRIDLGNDADNIRVDAAANRVIVGYGSGALAVIDAVSRSKSPTSP